MDEEKILILKIASVLLQFPDEAMVSSLGTLAEVICELPPGRPREVFAEFLTNFQGQSLLNWQEEYTRHFDLSPATCLHLTYHKYGDGRDRGAALAQLNQLYRQAGYETSSPELSDYLPLVLEFLAACPQGESLRQLAAYRPQVMALAERLQAAGSSYARLFSVVSATWPAVPA